MTSQQVWCFLPTAALLFLLSVQTIAEVMKSVSDCDRFLLDQTPPHIPGILEAGRILDQNRYKLICQTYGNQRRFVTLYDVRNRIPVFSAVKFTGEVSGRRPKSVWKIEPQVGLTAWWEMSPCVGAGAVDYRSNRTFDRGHIFPSSYASTKADKLSTFTLTNVVPQAESFNKGSWNKMERCYCVNSSGGTGGFVVTGALPSSSSTLNNRVNVPTALWSAFCCYSAVAQAWIASGHWGRNFVNKIFNIPTKILLFFSSYNKLNNSNYCLKICKLRNGTAVIGPLRFNCCKNTIIKNIYPHEDVYSSMIQIPTRLHDPSVSKF
uniref:Endonuclease domain-containing 1 protein-like n=1 Tax=Poecilia reticulata TaxID=8081 RepID=A0A3P9N2P8_POERE